MGPTYTLQCLFEFLHELQVQNEQLIPFEQQNVFFFFLKKWVYFSANIFHFIRIEKKNIFKLINFCSF